MNRFVTLLLSLDLIAEREAVKEREFTPPAMTELREYCDRLRAVGTFTKE